MGSHGTSHHMGILKHLTKSTSSNHLRCLVSVVGHSSSCVGELFRKLICFYAKEEDLDTNSM